MTEHVLTRSKTPLKGSESANARTLRVSSSLFLFLVLLRCLREP